MPVLLSSLLPYRLKFEISWICRCWSMTPRTWRPFRNVSFVVVFASTTSKVLNFMRWICRCWYTTLSMRRPFRNVSFVAVFASPPPKNWNSMRWICRCWCTTLITWRPFWRGARPAGLPAGRSRPSLTWNQVENKHFNLPFFVKPF